MKNIHLLLAGESYLSLNCSYRDSAIGTEVGKPYWTYSKDWKHYLSVTDASVRPHNIYITSDEEIKEGDWYYLQAVSDIGSDSGTYRCEDKTTSKLNTLASNCKKIILTTDQDLIKDGVQAIDDEFLEWFVKNPSCEKVEVERTMYYKPYNEEIDIPQFSHYKHSLTIPKEEPKQETLEEAADRLTYGSTEENKGFPKIKAFKAGAKWQQERRYSEEEVKKLIIDFLFTKGIGKEVESVNEWFEQFKNK